MASLGSRFGGLPSLLVGFLCHDCGVFTVSALSFGFLEDFDTDFEGISDDSCSSRPVFFWCVFHSTSDVIFAVAVA